MTHTASFNIQTSRDFLQELIIPQHDEFVRHNASARHALLTFILVYHMYEWVHGKSYNRDHFANKYPNDQHLIDMFELAKKIVNGTKHFESKLRTHAQVGFSSAFSDAFARPLNVEFPDGTKKSADIVLREIVEFWKRQELIAAPK